jgi:thiol-disulfide isomerase/thioredoxin
MAGIRSVGLRGVPVAAAFVALISSFACGSADAGSSPVPGSTPTLMPRSGPLLDLVGITGWINSEPLTVADQLRQNKVVLIDFWTYTCVNCLRTIPFLQQWQEKYKDHGLVIVGVHSPEFSFERDIENVRKAVEEEGVTWAVALDSDMRTWNAFGNRFWPAKYLIAPDDHYDFKHFGEGAYVDTENEIREALTAAGWDVSGIAVGTVNNSPRDQSVETSFTREIYGGYERSYHPQGLYAGDEEYYIAPDVTRTYVDDGEYIGQQFFLHGDWTNGPEAIVHARETETPADYIALLLKARSANVVVQPQGPEEFRVYVTLDDAPLTEEEKGDDILFDEDGESYFVVDSARMYRVVEQPEFRERVLKLSSTSDNFAVFAFTFGIYEGGF